MNRCVECGHAGLLASTAAHEVRVGDRVVRGKVPARRCPSCGESYTAASDLQRLELAVAQEVVRSGQVDGATFRFLRHLLGLQGKELADELGVAAETISRWETGAREVDRNAWLTVAMLVTDLAEGRTATRDALAATRHPRPMPKTVNLAS